MEKVFQWALLLSVLARQTFSLPITAYLNKNPSTIVTFELNSIFVENITDVQDGTVTGCIAYAALSDAVREAANQINYYQQALNIQITHIGGVEVESTKDLHLARLLQINTTPTTVHTLQGSINLQQTKDDPKDKSVPIGKNARVVTRNNPEHRWAVVKYPFKTDITLVEEVKKANYVGTKGIELQMPQDSVVYLAICVQ